MDTTPPARMCHHRVYIGRVTRGLAVLVCLALAPLARAETTVDRTIVPAGPEGAFRSLAFGPGEGYVVRDDLAKPRSGRARRRVSLVYFGQISDFQLADEESPARVEFLDPDPSGTASAAWRPGEALVPHQTDASIRVMNRYLASPVRQGDGTRARMLNALMTGDLADSAQLNETRWVLRLLEGGTLDPNSGTADLAGTTCPPGTPLDDPKGYTGVQDYDDYYRSDAFYDPDEPAGAWAGWPAYPGLMDRAQAPFGVEGLRVPSYVAFGNHDGLVQGNEDANASFEEVATGCVKPLTTKATDPFSSLDPVFLESVAADPSKTMLVPPDAARQYVDKAQYKGVFLGGRQKDGHGFAYVDPAVREASAGAAGYYAWSPAPGLRFVALDTISEGGVTGPSAEGNIDDPQFRWLEKELAAATGRGELIVVFGHHGTSSLTSDVPDEAASKCASNDEHGHDRNAGCDRDPRDSMPLHLGPEVASLFLKYPHVVTYVAGHAHNNRVGFYAREGGRGGFWEIKSPALSDWPPQDRAIEVMDNCDGTFSIFGTMLDHGAPLATPAPGTAAAGFDRTTLAGIGRALTYNDPQRVPNAVGERTDRNVELLLPDPRAKRPAAARLSLRVKPRRVRAGRRVLVRFRVRSAGKPVRGAVVRVGRRRASTNGRGVARMRVRLVRGARVRAVASKRLGCTKRRALVRIRAR
jgi:metallophosphoesterase (TIGR03767 family)